MLIFIALLTFVAGLACGFALRPGLERRRKLRSIYRTVNSRLREAAAPAADSKEPQGGPRDYYTADRRQRGTLAEGFGLANNPGRRAEDAKDSKDSEAEYGDVALPRDYYERETPEEEGLLSENYGVRRQPPQDAA